MGPRCPEGSEGQREKPPDKDSLASGEWEWEEGNTVLQFCTNVISDGLVVALQDGCAEAHARLYPTVRAHDLRHQLRLFLSRPCPLQKTIKLPKRWRDTALPHLPTVEGSQEACRRSGAGPSWDFSWRGKHWPLTLPPLPRSCQGRVERAHTGLEPPLLRTVDSRRFFTAGGHDRPTGGPLLTHRLLLTQVS